MAAARRRHAFPYLSMGTKLWWQGTSLAPRRSGFDSHRLHCGAAARIRRVHPRRVPGSWVTPRKTRQCSARGRGFESLRLHQASVVSTASTRPLYGRGAGSTPAGGSCTPVAQRIKALLCDGRGRRFESGRAFHLADVAQFGRASERHSGDARSIRVVRFRGTWCNWKAHRAPTSGVQVRILASLFVAGRSGWVISPVERAQALRFDSAPQSHPTTATSACCGPERFRLSTPNRQVAGSSPARSVRAPVAQLEEQFRTVTTRPQQ
jgi:hypothetical protein